MWRDIPAIKFRSPLQVTKVIVFSNGESYPVCPRCKITIEREYMRFCDRCGQRLSWKNFGKTIVMFK